jgi:phenylacetate-CoA ligase
MEGGMSYTSGPLRSLYVASPYLGKVLMASAYGWKQRRERYGEAFRENLAFLQESQYWPNDRLREYQAQHRDGFLRRALETSEYYRTRPVYAAALSGGNFADLPLLSKTEVRQHAHVIAQKDLGARPHRWVFTSGTTGSSLHFPVSENAFQREYAFRAHHNSWGGVRLHGRDRIAFCAGHPVAFIDRKRPPYWTYDLANNMMLFSSYHLTGQNLPHYVRELDRFQPLMLAGYPSSLYLLALAYEKYGTGKVHLRSVFTSSETLFDYQRQKIQSAFGAKVFNYYGNTEMGANAMECEQGRLHLKMEYSYVEVLNEKGNRCAPGEAGRLVCTGFGNDAFPLVRYEIGDTVTPAKNQQCPCGRTGLLLEDLIGRVEDYVVTPDGRVVGRLDHIFKETENVQQAQIVQHSTDEIILRIVKNDRYSPGDERTLLAAAHDRLGQSMLVRLEYVDSIPRTANGKSRFIESSIDQKRFLSNAFFTSQSSQE